MFYRVSSAELWNAKFRFASSHSTFNTRKSKIGTRTLAIRHYSILCHPSGVLNLWMNLIPQVPPNLRSVVHLGLLTVVPPGLWARPCNFTHHKSNISDLTSNIVLRKYWDERIEIKNLKSMMGDGRSVEIGPCRVISTSAPLGIGIGITFGIE